MSTKDKAFFADKRPWSKIKDRVLGSYMPPYLRKVQKLGQRILLIDCFAGPGKFYDGSPGSPLIMCQKAVQHAKNKCLCIFVNKKTHVHRILTETIRGFIEKNIAVTINADSKGLLEEIAKIGGTSSIFIYLDPFGLKGCSFEHLALLLSRGSHVSTEVLINLNMPAFHRLAASKYASKEGEDDPLVFSWHKILDEVFGGNYWRDVVTSHSLSAAEKEVQIIDLYCKKLREILPFVGSMPVRAREGSRVKYYMTFGSRSSEAIAIMNDIMLSAYMDHMDATTLEDLPLFKPEMVDWKSTRTEVCEDLRSLVLAEIGRRRGRSRERVWLEIVSNNFLSFHGSEYTKVTRQLAAEGKIYSPTSRKTRRLNEKCVLYIGSGK